MSDAPVSSAEREPARLSAATLAQLPLQLPEELRGALEAAYAAPPRAYHNLGHVAEVYHDAVYHAGRRDNEARSAQLAREHIARWLPQAGVDADRVAELIELTARHGAIARADVDEEPRLFLDGDMAILGAAAAQFDAYDRGIASEYRGHVPGPLFRLNRRRFLKGLLKRERIFLSDYYHARYDAAARNNLRRAVTTKR